MLLCTLIFIGMAVPFKVMVLIPGFTEVRPVNAVPVVAGLLFGPAGAWGCAIGNLIADFFGTFSQASVLGFIGNFIAAWLPYKLWHIAGRGEKPNVKSGRNIGKYFFISAVSAGATAIIIACGMDVFFDMWMPRFFWIILSNDLGFPLLFGLPFLIILTSADSQIEITLPPAAGDPLENPSLTQHTRIKFILLVILLTSELALIFMVAMGRQMSASPQMLVIGAIFLLSLLGLTVSRR